MKRWQLIVILLGLLGHSTRSVEAQDFSKVGSELQLKNLTEVEKIKFINQHYYQLYSADFKNAEELLSWAEHESLKLGLKKEYAFALLHGGVVQYLSGHYTLVLQKYLTALNLFESLNDEEGIAATHNELAVFYHKQNDLNQCFKSLDVAERISRKTNDLERLGTALGNRGAILSVRGRILEAKPYFLEVYKIRVQQNDSIGLGYVLLDLAEIAMAEGNKDSCMAYIDQSTQVRTKINDQYGVAVNLVFRGEMNLRAGNYPEAIRFLEEGNQKAQSIGYPDLVRQSAELLSNVWRLSGNIEKAFWYHQQADILKDSLLGVEKSRIIEELKTKYETEKREFEIKEQGYLLTRNRWLIGLLATSIVLLLVVFVLGRQKLISKKNKVLAEQHWQHQKEMTKALLISQEQERKRFASDLHDGMGQMISALRLVLQRSFDPIPPATMGMLDQMHQDIRNIAFDLSPTTLLAEGLPAGIRELVSRLNQSSLIRITVGSTSLEGRLPVDMELMLYRIAQEWINNVLRHGQANQVNIQIIQHPEQISMVIEDDGPGFDVGRLVRGGGNGWRNIQSRLSPYSGTVHVDSAEGKRFTVFIVEIPFLTLSI